MQTVRPSARGQQEDADRLCDDQMAYTTRVSASHMLDIMSYLITSQQFKKDRGWWVCLAWRTDQVEGFEKMFVPQFVYLKFRATRWEEMVVDLS